MASGDITKVQVLGRTKLPGGGRTQAGLASNDKEMAWGKITCTYVSTGVNPASATGIFGAGGELTRGLGFQEIDFAEFTIETTTGAVLTKDDIRTVAWDTGSDLLFALELIGGNDSAAPTNGDTWDLRFLVVGTSANRANLT